MRDLEVVDGAPRSYDSFDRKHEELATEKLSARRVGKNMSLRLPLGRVLVSLASDMEIELVFWRNMGVHRCPYTCGQRLFRFDPFGLCPFVPTELILKVI